APTHAPPQRPDDRRPAESAPGRSGAGGASQARGPRMIAALVRRRSPSDLSIQKEQRFYAGIFLLPTILIALGLVAYPLIYSLLLTVRGEGDLPGELGPWIGLSNWTHLAGDPVFRQSFPQSVMYVVPACVAGVSVAMAAAVVLNQDFPGRRIARACLL